MPKDLAQFVRPLLEPMLADGEALRGWCLATEQTTFTGHTTVVGITDQRLLLQPVDRKFRPKGAVLAIRPDELADVSADGAGGGWWTVNAAIMDAAAVKLKLETTGGEKRKLSMMRRGVGSEGLEALAEWLRAVG